MKQIEQFGGEGTLATIYETDGGEFFYRYDAMYLDENDDERVRSGESDRFPSLEALKASLPKRVVFLRDGKPVFDPMEHEETLKRRDEAFKRLQILEAERDERTRKGEVL